MSVEPPLLFGREHGIARLVLNRPKVGNAIDVPLARALMEAAIECDEDDSIRVVTLTGAGRLFCAGGDVAAFADAGARFSALLKELTAYVHSAVSRFSRMGKPMVTIINGPAAGAGFNLSLLGDVAIAGASAHFLPAYTGIGLTPDGGATWLLPRLVGLRKAQEILLLNKRVSAAEAAEIGMITRVVPDDELAAQAEAVVTQLGGGATRALGRTRNLLADGFGRALEEQLEQEARNIAAAGRDAESREGVAAYLEKRKPNFS
ncbi:enoyl-CoA hydratase/isomerase family protein [Acidocella sp.]|uniref:enoyl-CoA hydratase/isomerase family protein n=1 Tax=Acidocella sp. TaxID=50710 RepID=UPI00260D5D79|nr:enoyl-CoA hydratase-related protein [Acidocella sp.]